MDVIDDLSKMQKRIYMFVVSNTYKMISVCNVVNVVSIFDDSI